MIRTLWRLTPSLTMPLISSDKIDRGYDVGNKNSFPKSSGWKGIKDMYSMNEYGEISEELGSAWKAACSSAFISSIVIAAIKMRKSYQDFVKNNEEFIYKHTREAQKRLRDASFKAIAEGVIHWGWRVGLVTGVLFLVGNTISVYRGEQTITEYAVVAAAAGAFAKVKKGPRAMLDAAVISGLLTFIGVIILLEIFKLTAYTLEDVKDGLYNSWQSRKDGNEVTAVENVHEERASNLQDNAKQIETTK